METKTIRRVPALLAAAMITSVTATAFAASASASARTSVSPACASTQGKYDGHLVATYDITGGDDSTQGVPGGTLQVWASGQCQTLWTKTVKLPAYTDKPYLTTAAISYFNTTTQQWTQKRTEQTTTADIESPTVPATNGCSGRFPVEGGFLGTFYQFDSAHTYKYCG